MCGVVRLVAGKVVVVIHMVPCIFGTAATGAVAAATDRCRCGQHGCGGIARSLINVHAIVFCKY